MAGKSESVAEPPAAEAPLTQRAYTLRLRGIKPQDNSWRDALWATHEAVNKGAKVFGDWLLTLRGGLSHDLAEPAPPPKGKPRSDAETAALRKNRRILLALSWLSVEDERGAPEDSNLIVAYGERCKRAQDNQESRDRKVEDAFRGVLSIRGLAATEADSWVCDCAGSLKVRIRDDAVWINRSLCFDCAVNRVGSTLTRDEVWDLLGKFFKSQESYLAPAALSDDSEDREEKSKDLVQYAGQWLSSRYGTGPGADFERMAAIYSRIAQWANSANAGATVSDLAQDLHSAFGTESDGQNTDLDWLLTISSYPGHTPNPVHERLTNAADGLLVAESLKALADAAQRRSQSCQSKIGSKGSRPYADAILQDVEAACGMTYLLDGGASRHFKFAVMLDHAARRLSIGHSWIKRAEAERQKFTTDAMKLDAVPQEAKRCLDDFCENRARDTGANESSPIRKRALGGTHSKAWKAVVEAWFKCASEEDRKAKVTQIQSDWDDEEKFGHEQLFTALAADDAICVWKVDGQVTAKPLIDYATATDALAMQRRFKVPAYRHPDPLSHPVFCDFGKSRWDVDYAIHRARFGMEDARRKVERCQAAVEKAQASLDKTKQPDQQVKAKDKLGKARQALAEARTTLAWLSDSRALSMSLWSGDKLNTIDRLRWSSKRLAADLGLAGMRNGKGTSPASRADRLGRAATGIATGGAVAPTGLFEQEQWSARLQAPRWQLNRLAAHVEQHGWDDKACKLRDRLSWLVTLSAELKCDGPFVQYAIDHTLIDRNRDVVLASKREVDEWRGIAYPIWHPANDGHKGLAKHILSRLPSLRVLSVDLGHRFAASCAVWEAISAEEMAKACREHGHQKPRESDLFIHLTRTVKKVRKKGRDKGKTADVAETTIYRRLGADTLPDDKPHPAPWARLDRQFFIKLQGEERPARAATNGKFKDGSPTETNEIEMVAEMARDLGQRRDDADESTGRGVDELMRRAVRIATLGLKRHGRMAKIAYAFKPDCPGIPGMGGAVKAITRGDDDHVKFITNALADWHALSTDTEWDGSAARQIWNNHIKPLQTGFEIGEPTPPDPNAERPSRQQRRQSEEDLRDRLRPIAEHFARANAGSTRDIHDAWAKLWTDNDGIERKSLGDPAKSDFAHTPIHDKSGKVVGSRTAPKKGKESPGGWHARLRLLTDWVMGRRLPGAPSKDWNRNVGGLSLTRISTMRSLYQLHKSFAMRARPCKIQGAPEQGESNAGVAQSILDAMEHMREQRVKQIASRIVEAALGVGIERDRVWNDEKKKWRYAKRPRSPLYHEDGEGTPHGDPRFKTCHAVVIENLRNYRPDELQTRRENRALMNWSAGKVRKYLEEACELHGLHLREVMPNYTSRQCSRTGQPGIRCMDVYVDPIAGEPKAYWWKKALSAARKKAGNGDQSEKRGDGESRFIIDLADQLVKFKADGKPLPETVRVPRKAGDLFVAAPPWSCHADAHRPCPLCDAKRAVQADLNAAANIGLRALLDPDFPGRWWYVPAAMDNEGWRVPAPKSCTGAACLDGWKVAQKDGCFRTDGTPLGTADDESVKRAEEAVASAKKVLDAAKKAAKKPGADQTGLCTAKECHEKAKAALKDAKKAASQKEIVNIWQDPRTDRPQPSAGRWRETTAYWSIVRARVISRLRAATGLDEPEGAEPIADQDVSC
ncbi:MAG: type V CRISPR-associated protein Cas12b [Phycisphaeraceae bacterium]|nr:type V CRISPR-associated protein Cas12b [Phycisphaerae bacterium]MBX3392986.1 type V CRISPR-associated protein Cas12b [Phycisphaeraceae bacterium]